MWPKYVVNKDLGVFPGADIFLGPGTRTIFVKLSTKTTMDVNPPVSSKPVTRLVVVSAHFLEGISKGYNNPTFALLVNFMT